MKRKKRKSKKKPSLSIGVELEAYSIAVQEKRICRELHFPRRGSVEKGERFLRDWSIGTEYNSKVFTTIREAIFLLKNGLRKYTHFRKKVNGNNHHVIFPVGGWIDRFAGCHIHIALGKKGIAYDQGQRLAPYLYSHIPFLIALTANSPVWRNKITSVASNRLLLGSDKYCKVSRPTKLYKQHYREITFNKGKIVKPSTLEIRICDSSLPEFTVAALCVSYAVALRWLRHKPPLNRSTQSNHLKARDAAIRNGVKARLVWSNHWITVPQYVDLLFRKYKDEFDEMDIPDEILSIFKYLKKGWNQAEVIRQAAVKCRKKNAATWQRQFAVKYIPAIQELLDGNSYTHFAHRLGITLPKIKRTWLGHAPR
ncbi:MAG: hypothetical protein KKH94_05500 [Candidatus Omnitrophica bacterium]|nr:hypothetical protein [Candidatus Omnitrophota bacterium]